MPSLTGDDRRTVVRLAMKRATTANPIGGLPVVSTKGTYRSTVRDFKKLVDAEVDENL
jgi:hypothetical protein